MAVVYTAFCTDIIHEGHLNIIRNAQRYGEVVLGALSDKALIRYNKFPTISQDERIRLYESLEGVSRVIVQDDYLYDAVIEQLRPDYVIHGDNWQSGPESVIRANVLDLLSRFGGELIEVTYTRSEEARKIDQQLREKLAMPEYRRRRLRQLLEISPTVKVIEAHDGLTGLIAEKTVVNHDNRLDQFDGMWVSSLCDSTERGKPRRHVRTPTHDRRHHGGHHQANHPRW